MAWIFLFAAGLTEVAWAIGLKASRGFTRPGVTAATVAVMILSFLLLARAMKSLPLSTAYPIWVGIGTVGAAIAGAVFFKERLGPAQIVCIALIAVGIAGLKALTPAAQPPVPETLPDAVVGTDAPRNEAL